MEITPELHKQLLAWQQMEINGVHIYRMLAQRTKEPENRRVIEEIAKAEQRHYALWQRYTHTDVNPQRRLIVRYSFLTRIFGFTFAIRLLEQGEAQSQASYSRLIEQIPEAAAVMHEEEMHEEAFIGMLDEERLRYVGSMVLGLNDALVELTGALAGFTLALQNTALIALTGLITGIAAALSMATSEYLSTKAEEDSGAQNPLRAALYTGGAYLLTVFALIAPYLILKNFYVCLAVTLAIAILIIAIFNYYLAVARGQSFKRRFLEMAGISLGVATLSFFIGWLTRLFLGVEI
ncbi:MAG TPA: VIT1/CCC1 transporter family protein [Anaerolineae bacterium]|nr:VIT1/CCC1 transporter family protein [Anaerolineae bacterium]